MPPCRRSTRWTSAGAGINDIFAEFESHWLGSEVEGDKYLPAEAAFFRDVVSGVVRDQAKLDPMIDDALSKGWPLKRIDAILRAVLRAGAYELEHRKDVPARVVVSEYVDVAHAFVDARRDRHGQRRARPDRAPVSRRRVRARLRSVDGAWLDRQERRQPSGEDSLIARYFRPIATDPGAFGLSDDAAILKPHRATTSWSRPTPSSRACIFCPTIRPTRIARKALRVNLSDLAAKGARPAGFVLTLALRDADEAWLAPFARGAWRGRRAVRLSAARRRYGLDAGAADDLDHGVRARARRAGWSVAAARKPGDRVMVTGTIGDAALGLDVLKGGAIGARWRMTPRRRDMLVGRYRVPQPRNALAEAVRDHANAAMDVSDGLAGDLAKLCAASGVSAVIDAARIPFSAAAAALAARGAVGIEAIVAGGDDYEILCAVPENRFEAFAQAAGPPGSPSPRSARSSPGGRFRGFWTGRAGR